MNNAVVAAERDRLLHEIADLNAKCQQRRLNLADLDRRLDQLRTRVADAEGEAELQDIGVCRFRHRLEDAVTYKARLDELRDAIRSLARSGTAVSGDTDWEVNGSIAKPGFTAVYPGLTRSSVNS